MAMTHDKLEELVTGQGTELLRSLLQDHLKLRARMEERERSVTGRDEVERTHVRERELMTVVGSVEVERKAYSARGHDSVMPMDAQLNLPAESFSLGVRRRVALEVARGSYEEAVEAINTTTAARVSKRQVEELAARAAADFDAFYAVRQQEKLGAPPVSPAAPEFVVLTTDAKGIVMRKEALREETQQAAATAMPGPCKRVAPGKKPNRKRMAQVASVYEVAPFVRRPVDIVTDLHPVPEDKRPPAPRPRAKRVWASLVKDAKAVISEMFDEARSRDPTRSRRWVVLVDGNEAQLDAIKRLAKRHRVKPTILLDIIHVVDYLWDAGLCLFPPDTAELQRWVDEHLLDVLCGRAAQVAAGIRRSATKRRMSKTARKNMDKCANYLKNHAEYMDYARCLAEGTPIATGVIEGTCRYLVKDRMDITGARWGLNGAEAVLRLRALKKSGDFEEYWAFHLEQEHLRNHGMRPAQPTESASEIPTKPNLKLIRGGASS